MKTSVLHEIHKLQQMTVSELQLKWRELYGEETRSRNRTYLWRRLAWRVQEIAHGGLSDAAKQRIEELAPDGFTPARTPQDAIRAALLKHEDRNASRPTRTARDPRLPSPGTVLTRQYHGREIRVVTLEDGFEWEGQRYGSLSAVAKAVTGAKWNGLLFFGITKRRRS